MNIIKYTFLKAAFFLLPGLALVGCKKDKQAEKTDNSKISQIVADNFNLSIYNTGLVRSGLNLKLNTPGPFTAIAPSDDAFAKAGLGTTVAVLSADPARISAIMNYHVLNGSYELNKLPFLFNQEIRSASGGKLFVTHWVKGKDTVLTINGSKVLALNMKASNGLIQVINRMLEPYTFDYVTDALAADRNLSLFYQALQRAGLIETLRQKGPYTLFAPDNQAMISYGLSTLQSINEADPAVLKTLMSYHIVSDRRFVYDYVLSTNKNELTGIAKSEQTMLNGNSVTVTLTPDVQVPGAFSGIQVSGTGNTAPISVLKQDVLTGNGIIHTISGVLKITQ